MDTILKDLEPKKAIVKKPVKLGTPSIRTQIRNAVESEKGLLVENIEHKMDGVFQKGSHDTQSSSQPQKKKSKSATITEIDLTEDSHLNSLIQVHEEINNTV